MAKAQKRKRASADDFSVLQEHRPDKKLSTRDRPHGRSNFPPEFWDNLPKIPLTRRALRELGRRNSAQPAQEASEPLVYSKNLAAFARHGGPDLRHLRGYPEPKHAAHAMASSRSASTTKRTSTKATSVTKSRASSAYDKAFEQHLYNNNVYLHDEKSKPNNQIDIQQPRKSLSPSRFDDDAFKRYRREHDKLGSEGDVMRKIIPVIAGAADIPNSGEVLFSNLESMTDGATVDVKPDFYDGAEFFDIDTAVTRDLNNMIVPSDTNVTRRPAAPNFFLEAKAPWGGADVAKRQAALDGAIGARAMYALQNYGAEEPVFDGNAHTFSSTYHAGTGTLQLYMHHVTPPTVPGGRPEYHMTHLDDYALMGKRERFVEGATAFRNARDLAQRYRDQFIQAANTRARQPNLEVPLEADVAIAASEQFEESVRDQFGDCVNDSGSGCTAENRAVLSGDAQRPGQPQHAPIHEEEQDLNQPFSSPGTEPTMSLAPSATVEASAQYQNGSKRARASHSPPSSSQRHKKHDSAKRRARHASREAAGSAAPGVMALKPAQADEYWTWSDEFQKWYHLNEDGSSVWDAGE